MGDDFPDNLTVDAEILVHDPVAKPHDKGPFNVATSVARRICKAARSLTDDLQVSNHRIDGFPIGEEILPPCAGDIPGNPAHGFEHVLYEEAVGPTRPQRSPPLETASSWDQLHVMIPVRQVRQAVFRALLQG